MKRIIIIGEGPTEQAFCNDVLQPHFNKLDIFIQNPTIKKSNGGIVAWAILKKEIEIYLKSDKAAYVTTLIDYYGILDKHVYPEWIEAHKKPNKADRMTLLENAMVNGIDESLRHRFIPYVQLHEFEGLLFTNFSAFENNFSTEEFVNKKAFKEIFDTHPNPEDINNNPISAPSVRIKQNIPVYSKVAYGSLIAQETGLQQIRNKCPRFNNWVEKIEAISSQ
jgi:hypothetical protein